MTEKRDEMFKIVLLIFYIHFTFYIILTITLFFFILNL